MSRLLPNRFLVLWTYILLAHSPWTLDRAATRIKEDTVVEQQEIWHVGWPLTAVTLRGVGRSTLLLPPPSRVSKQLFNLLSVRRLRISLQNFHDHSFFRALSPSFAASKRRKGGEGGLFVVASYLHCCCADTLNLICKKRGPMASCFR